MRLIGMMVDDGKLLYVSHSGRSRVINRLEHFDLNLIE